MQNMVLRLVKKPKQEAKQRTHSSMDRHIMRTLLLLGIKQRLTKVVLLLWENKQKQRNKREWHLA